MNKTPRRRIPLLVSLAAAIALSVSACGGHLSWGPESGATNSANSATPAPAASSGQFGAASSSGATSGTSGQNGLTGGAPGGSNGGSSGQFGVTGSTGGASAGTPGISAASTGLSPDQVAEYCKSATGWDPDTSGLQGPLYFRLDIPKLKDWRSATPVQYQPNVDIIITDYQAIADQTRRYSQLSDEIHSAFKPLNSLTAQICQ